MQIEQLNETTKARLMVVDANAAVQAAALSLSKPGIGLVVVCDDNGVAAGVLSKSDLIRHLTSPKSPARTQMPGSDRCSSSSTRHNERMRA